MRKGELEARTFCASHEHQEVNEQEGPASQRTTDKKVTINESHGAKKTPVIHQAGLSQS